MPFNVLEIRSYLFAPDMLEHFIDYFEQHFIGSQEAVGMTPLGQFRQVGEPNRFVWIRGFENMRTRRAALEAFYGGPVWKQLGPFANEMMLEWHDVRLVKPASDITALTGGQTSRRIADTLADGTISAHTGLVAVDVHRAEPDRRAALTEAYVRADIQLRGTFEAEMAENDFPRLPVIQNAAEFTVVSAYPDAQTAREQRAGLPIPAESLLLAPTLRSPIRYSR